MAEKEASYETATGGGGQQKSADTVLHLPSLTSKPTRAHNNKQQEAEGKPSDSSAASGGYYLNVAQKGKLILPTALWILLILAGVAFLGLLASLSRTIDTLDTLVELEQEKEARASISEQLARRVHAANRHKSHDHEHGHKHEHRHRLTSTTERPSWRERDESPRRHHANVDGDLDFSDAGMLLPKASWFSLPGWTSLEPARPAALQHPDGEVNGVTIEIAGGNNGPMPPVGMINSIMSQVMPMLDGLMGPPPPPPPPPARPAAPVQQVLPQEEDLGALISAKIDNLNINWNAARDEQRHKHKISSSREEEIKSLESSVDDLVAKLMAQKLAHGGSSSGEPDALELAPHHLHAPKVEEIMPVIRLPPPPPHVHHHSLVRPGPPLSPLASLLMASGGGGRPPMRPMGGDDGDSPAGTMIFGPFSGGPASLGRMPMIIDDLNPAGSSKRPAGSPYELAHHMPGHHLPAPLLDSFKDLDEMIRKGSSSAVPPAREPSKKQKPAETEAKWEMLSNDLADALVRGALGDEKQQQPPAPEATTTGLPKSESVVVVNGKQLEGDERDKFLSSIFGPSSTGSTGSASETKSPLGDLMSAMFEPTTHATGKQSDETPRPTQTTAGPSSVSVSSPAATSGPIPVTASKSTTSTSPAVESDTNSPADMVNDLLSSVFAMPQFSGASSPQQASGGSPPASGSSSPSVTREPQESSSGLVATNTEPGVPSTRVTQAPSVGPSATAPESSMLSTLIEALHTPHMESELAKDSLLREFLGVSSPKEAETSQQVMITTPVPTTTMTTTTTSTAPTTTTVSPVGRSSGAQVIREEDAPTNMPIFDLGPFARSTSPSIETLKESPSPTPVPTTTPSPVSVDSSTAAPMTTTTPVVVANSTGGKNSTTEPLSKSFLQKADDFIERNLMNFKRFF